MGIYHRKGYTGSIFSYSLLRNGKFRAYRVDGST